MKFKVKIVRLIKFAQIESKSSMSYQTLFSDVFPILVPYADDAFRMIKKAPLTIQITSLSN